MPFALSIPLYLLLAVGLLVWLRSRMRGPREKYPPGPPHWPVIGSALELPDMTNAPWLVWSEWAKKYGDIIYAEALGQSIVLISSAKIAKDLLDKRSAIYSDRPQFVMAGELTSYSEGMVLLPYGDRWRLQRKFIAQDLSPSGVTRYQPFQEAEARHFVRNALQKPERLRKELELRMGTIIIRVTYGYYLTGEDDPILRNPIQAMENFSKASAPGAWAVDFIPPLRYLPKWMPGAGFLRTAEKWKQIALDATMKPLRWSKENYRTGTTIMPNICATVFAENEDELSAFDENQLAWSASTVLGGGLDTNTSTILSFMKAMILYPHVQKKAQAELDTVIGQDRLPAIADKDDLPYLRSVIAEVLRWAPPAPLSIAHALSRDDVYEEYFLPKGALVIPNVWYMTHDPTVYQEAHKFNPDRFKNDSAEMQKINELVFGFGRRRCPGIHFAEGTLFAVMSTLLATCDILPELDENGKEILPEVAYSSGTIVLPKPFNCRLRSRSERVKELLQETANV